MNKSVCLHCGEEIGERTDLFLTSTFRSEQWREAAERFLELDRRLNELEHQDSSQDHDAMAENFERCDVCEQITALMHGRNEFAQRFATKWAREALELQTKRRNL